MMEEANLKIKKPSSMKKKNREQKLFYWIMLAIPLLQFIIFYIVVNFRSILYAFQVFDRDAKVFIGFGFENFARIFKELGGAGILEYAISNSLILYACGLVMGTGLGLLFSFYIYKKYFLAEFFRVILFLPQIISAIVLTVIYKFMIETLNGYESFLGSSGFYLVLFFTLWMGFGTSSLMYTSAMSSISDSVVESAELDGVTPIKEFWYITIPMVYPTLVTFLTVGVAGIFTNQMNLYSFFGTYDATPDQLTFGYYLYKEVQKNITEEFGYLSALGVLMTCIAVPITLTIKHLLEKYGPSAE